MELQQVEQWMAEVAMADAAERRLTAQMDAELTKVREKYAAALEAEQRRKTLAEEELASWAGLNKEELASWAGLNKEVFGAKRSLKLVHGVMGWRLGTPALKLRSRIKADMAFEKVKHFYPEYIRTKEEVNKEAILAAYAGKQMDDDTLAACGYQVRQEERFYIEPKTEEEP